MDGEERQVLAQGVRDAETALAQVEGGVPAAALFRALHDALPASSSIVDEIVAQIPQMMQFLFESKPFRQYRGWTGALGTGLGTALGVKLARPGDTVVCVIGDGALHYNPVPAALGFAQQQGPPSSSWCATTAATRRRRGTSTSISPMERPCGPGSSRERHHAHTGLREARRGIRRPR